MWSPRCNHALRRELGSTAESHSAPYFQLPTATLLQPKVEARDSSSVPQWNWNWELVIDPSEADEAVKFLNVSVVLMIMEGAGFVTGTWMRSADGRRMWSLIIYEDEEAAKAAAGRAAEGPPLDALCVCRSVRGDGPSLTPSRPVETVGTRATVALPVMECPTGYFPFACTRCQQLVSNPASRRLGRHHAPG